MTGSLSVGETRPQLQSVWNHHALLAVCLVFGGLLRLLSAGVPLWGDELVTLEFVVANGPVELLTAIPANQPHYPAYYVLIRLWGDLTGLPYETGRVISVLAGTATVAVVYEIGRERWGQRIGIAAAALTAAAPPLVLASGWLRMYALLGLATATSVWALVRVSNGRDGWFMWTVSTVAAISLHPFGLFVAALAPVALLDGEWPRLRHVAPVAMTAVAATGVLVWKLTTRGGRPADLKHLTTPPGIFEVLLAPGAMLGGRVATAVQVIVTVVVTLAVVHSIREPRKHSIELAWLLVPVLGAAAVSHVLAPIYQLKYLLLAAPAVALIVAKFLDNVTARPHRVVGGLAMVQLLVLVLVPQAPWLALRVIP